jgi:hypothetical protein
MRHGKQSASRLERVSVSAPKSLRPQNKTFRQVQDQDHHNQRSLLLLRFWFSPNLGVCFSCLASVSLKLNGVVCGRSQSQTDSSLSSLLFGSHVHSIILGQMNLPILSSKISKII